MNFFAAVRAWAKSLRGKKNAADQDRAFLVFEHTGEVIQAEQVLKQAGVAVQVKGPPRNLRTGCDMVLEYSLMEELAVNRALAESGIRPVSAAPVRERLLEPVSLFQITDYGPWLMVRAANMKITVEKSTSRIVNVSGGGCPDVPFLAASLVGKEMYGENPPPEPRALGRTLCGYALQLAFEEAQRRCPCPARG